MGEGNPFENNPENVPGMEVEEDNKIDAEEFMRKLKEAQGQAEKPATAAQAGRAAEKDFVQGLEEDKKDAA